MHRGKLKVRRTERAAQEVSRLVQRLPLLDDSIERLLRMDARTSLGKDALLQIVKRDPGLCSQFLVLPGFLAGRDSQASYAAHGERFQRLRRHDLRFTFRDDERLHRRRPG